MSKQGVMADFDDLHLVLTGWNRYFRSIEQNLLTRCLSAELHFVWAEINVYVSVSSKEKSLSYSLLLFIRWSIMFRICFENLKSMVCEGKGIQTGLIFVKLKKKLFHCLNMSCKEHFIYNSIFGGVTYDTERPGYNYGHWSRSHGRNCRCSL